MKQLVDRYLAENEADFNGEFNPTNCCNFPIEKLKCIMQEAEKNGYKEVVKEALYPCGKIHPHQWRVRRASLESLGEKLFLGEKEILACNSFDSLHRTIAALETDGINVLTIYDVALRIGFAYGHEPDEVYLHAGVIEGAKKLEIPLKEIRRKENYPKKLCAKTLSRKFILKLHWLNDLERLTCYQIENFLCSYKHLFETP